jgi:hypothetical protein
MLPLDIYFFVWKLCMIVFLKLIDSLYYKCLSQFKYKLIWYNNVIIILYTIQFKYLYILRENSKRLINNQLQLLCIFYSCCTTFIPY